jgi:hypothetical protein
VKGKRKKQKTSWENSLKDLRFSFIGFNFYGFTDYRFLFTVYG